VSRHRGGGWSALACGVAAAMVACSAKTRSPGGVEMILETDMQTPRDFDALHLVVQQETSPGQFHSLEDQTYEIPLEATLPTTYAIAAGSAADQTALIRVTALRQGVSLPRCRGQSSTPLLASTSTSIQTQWGSRSRLSSAFG
jgi:hypothetical protein